MVVSRDSLHKLLKSTSHIELYSFSTSSASTMHHHFLWLCTPNHLSFSVILPSSLPIFVETVLQFKSVPEDDDIDLDRPPKHALPDHIVWESSLHVPAR